MPEETVLIQPMPVVRNIDGNWTHPDLPMWGEGESGETIKAWFDAQGMERKQVMLEDDLSADAYGAWQAKGDYDAEGWEPTKPEGEGWFCLSIHDTDDGPVCWWAKRESGLQQELNAVAAGMEFCGACDTGCNSCQVAEESPQVTP